MNETVDLTFLKSFAGNSPEKMAKYINMFLNSAPAAMNTIQTCLQNQDWAGLKSSAHSLKPQISYMGIKSAEDLIKSIELNASEKINLDAMPQQVSSLKDILEKAYPELKQAADF
jgi:HPt (histidine-containing phosphotransfer) domain-containing protein